MAIGARLSDSASGGKYVGGHQAWYIQSDCASSGKAWCSSQFQFIQSDCATSGKYVGGHQSWYFSHIQSIMTICGCSLGANYSGAQCSRSLGTKLIDTGSSSGSNGGRVECRSYPGTTLTETGSSSGSTNNGRHKLLGISPQRISPQM